jgi:hypothetical protein
MISATGGTNLYILQAGLVEKKHRKTLEWLSQTVLWKTELKVFQGIVDSTARSTHTIDEKKRLAQFQNLITYYSGEVVVEIRKQLRAHENKLARMLETHAEWDVEYIREHDSIMEDAQTIGNRLIEIRNELTAWQKTLKN